MPEETIKSKRQQYPTWLKLLLVILAWPFLFLGWTLQWIWTKSDWNRNYKIVASVIFVLLLASVFVNLKTDTSDSQLSQQRQEQQKAEIILTVTPTLQPTREAVPTPSPIPTPTPTLIPTSTPTMEPYPLQFKDLGAYKSAGTEWRNISISQPITSKDKIVSLAKRLHKEYPDTPFHIFDDERYFEIYKNWDLNYTKVEISEEDASHCIGIINTVSCIERIGVGCWQLLLMLSPNFTEWEAIDLE